MNAAGAELTLVIPVRNGAPGLKSCLDAIAGNPGVERVSVVVADNGSTDQSAAIAAAAGATVLALPGHRVGELRNIAASVSASSLIGFVDADHIVDSGWIGTVREIFTDPDIAAAGAPYSPAPNANWVQRAYDRFRPTLTHPEPAAWLGSGNLVVRREAFERVQGFDGSLEACEDVDLCNRLRAAGYRLIADPRLRSVHLGDPSSLRALFFGELWRGRGNVKVTLRGPLTLRAIPSVAIPMVNLVALAAATVGLLAGFRTAGLALLIVAAFAAVRAVRMGIGRGRLTPSDVGANFVVAAVYEIARALSLVVRGTHRARRETAGERAVA
jgi:GT2 family glycosyltransferase